jgi:hypothetical protein
VNAQLLPLNYQEDENSPEVDIGSQVIVLSVNEMRYTRPLVEIEFHISFEFPGHMAQRYDQISNALVLVGTDIDQQDCFALRMVNEFVRSARNAPAGVNLLQPPPLPLAPRGDPEAGGYEGGWVNGAMSFESPRPVHRPNIFLYMVLENYVSNTVGLDLIGAQILNL